jgi:hypothetical protein
MAARVIADRYELGERSRQMSTVRAGSPWRR